MEVDKKMARRRFRRGGGVFAGGNPAMKGLGAIVGILLGLYAFDQVLDAIWATINTSTFFSGAVTFAQTILPVVGLIGIFYVIWRTLRAMGLI